MGDGFFYAIPYPGVWADAILVLHALIVCFVIGGLVAILIGGWRDWSWVRNFWFRLVHLTTIVFVVLQAWLGRLCPLTIWEHELRHAAGQFVIRESFIERWLGELLYWDLPWWAFVVAYSAFGLVVAWSWWQLPPARPGRS